MVSLGQHKWDLMCFLKNTSVNFYIIVIKYYVLFVIFQIYFLFKFLSGNFECTYENDRIQGAGIRNQFENISRWIFSYQSRFNTNDISQFNYLPNYNVIE